MVSVGTVLAIVAAIAVIVLLYMWPEIFGRTRNEYFANPPPAAPPAAAAAPAAAPAAADSQAPAPATGHQQTQPPPALPPQPDAGNQVQVQTAEAAPAQ